MTLIIFQSLTHARTTLVVTLVIVLQVEMTTLAAAMLAIKEHIVMKVH